MFYMSHGDLLGLQFCVDPNLPFLDLQIPLFQIKFTRLIIQSLLRFGKLRL